MSNLMRIDQMLDRSATIWPQTIALRATRSWTYAALRDEALRRAAILVDANVPVGARVIAVEPTTQEMILAFLACACASAVFVPLSPLLAISEIIALADRLAPTHWLSSAATPPVPTTAQHLFLALPGEPTSNAQQEVAHRRAIGSPDDPAVIRATSGTTGNRPKLVVQPHRQQTWPPLGEREGYHHGAICAITRPNQFISVNTCQIFGCGATLVELSDSLLTLESELAANQVTTLLTTPAHLAALISNPTPPPATIALRRIYASTAPLSREISAAVVARYGTPAVTKYSSTEATIFSFSSAGIPDDSIGQPAPGVEAQLLDDTDQPVATGETGELVLRSPGIMLGYFDDPVATAAVLHNGWFRTHDLARRDEQNNYYIVGRKSLQINTGGYKVTPEDVEAVLLQHPGVKEAVVLAAPDPKRGAVVRAIIVPHDPAPSSTEIRRFCRTRLARYAVPRIIEFRNELPKSPTGKVLRQLL